MSEIYTLIDEKPIVYKGIFKLDDLFQLIDNFFKERGYERREIQNVEERYRDGDSITFEFFNYKKIDDYSKKKIRIYGVLTDLKEKRVKIDDIKQKVIKGEVKLYFDAYIESDYKTKWEGHAFFYFLRTIVDKYIRKTISSKAKDEVVADTNKLIDEIKSFLKMSRYKTTS